MPMYKYVAKETTGKTVTGTLEYSERGLLIDALRKKGLVIISVNEIKKKKAHISYKNINPEDIVIFSRQLATMIESGISLVQSMDILQEQTEKSEFRSILSNIRDEIEVGCSFSDALSKHKAIFSPLYINMVKAGESSGALDDILDRLANYLEKALSLTRKVRASLIYPCVVLSMAGIITLVMLLKVIPTFKGIFDMLGGQLPLPTRILIFISDSLRRMFLYFVFGFLGCIFAFKKYILTVKGRRVFDSFILRMPVLGPLFRKVAIARFTRTLATLVRSGVPILISLEIVGKTSGNRVIEDALDNVRAGIKEGENIADPLAKSKVFPPLVVRMIHVGEETGQLEKMLGKIADFYDEQVDIAVGGLTNLMEPLVIGFLGIVIGSIVIALFLPIFKMTELIAH